ncbi:MAG: pantoate--beta-alanine ligase [Deltaproteobacteria bacterium]|nr:pantoate--beta-alanine ligase [Deltaproteobacteria bacterium]
MEVIDTIDRMQQRAEFLRSAGHTLAFVPTMGFLHEGHLELMRVGKKHADKVIISIFVNPTQFGPGEDYEQYPRDPEGDLKTAEKAGVDVVFMPTAEEMYPDMSQTRVVVERLPNHLCGLSRPGHFDGVTTVVAKLFHVTQPHLAIFGQKDFQQLTVITRMVMDLSMDIRIVGVPTVREPDGLAMSSRNKYLSQKERKSALCLKESLDTAQRLAAEGETESRAILSRIEALILNHSYTEIDYVELCDPVTLDHTEALKEETLLALAVRVGKTRLIDNCILRRGG